jgi:hypothetical protein
MCRAWAARLNPPTGLDTTRPSNTSVSRPPWSVLRPATPTWEGRDRGAQTHSQQSLYYHGTWLGAVRCIRGIFCCIRNLPTDSTALRRVGPIIAKKIVFFLMPGSRDQACLLCCRRTAEFCGRAPERRALSRHPLPPDILTRQQAACRS